MKESPAIEDPPPPPSFPPLKARTVDPEFLASLQENVPQDFQKIVVHGKTKSPERRRRAAFKPSDQHLITARLKLFCYDKTTGKPLPNVQVQLKAVPGNDPDRVVAKTVSNAFGNRAVSRKDGFVVCKVLAGYPYRVHASATGYHDFGHMGETLTLMPQETEVVQGEVGLVPVRIAVVVTLRELRPLHQSDSVQRDTTGQVNALLSMPRVDPRSGVPPQKVSFYSSDGIKMDFVATTVELEDVLVGWPATLGNTAEAASCTLGVYSTDNNGHCFFYGPKLVGKRSNSRKPREWTSSDVGRWEYARKYHLRANLESPVFMLFDDFGKPVDYPAHVARYPPRAMRSPSPTRGLRALLGRSREEILSSFLESAAQVAAVASSGGSVADPNEPTTSVPATTVAASTSGGPPGDEAAEAPAVADGEAAADTAADAVTAANGAVTDGAVPPEPQASRSQSASQRRVGSPLRSSASKSALIGDASGVLCGGPSGGVLGGGASGAVGAGASRQASAMSLTRSHSAPRNVRSSTAAAPGAEGAEGEVEAVGNADLDAELRAYANNKIHNYLDPGQYRLQMKDPSRLLIFYTYSGDGEAAEINRAQNAVVPFNMHNADESFIHPRDGSVLRPTKFPVQLYCRARPWFQIAVYNMATLEEVGASYGLRFSIERIVTNSPSAAAAIRAKEQEAARGGALGRRRKNAATNDSDDMMDLSDFMDGDAANGGQDDSMVYPYKVMEVEEIAEPLYSGMLGEIKEKLWMTPGEKYRVTVGMRSPFLEYNSVQVRTANWELEPFVFYAVKKVVMMVEVREKYNQLPIPNTEVVVEVREPPQAPRPPVVRPEWCEDPKGYALRVIDQLIDYVVQNNRERAAVEQGPVKEYRGFTDAEGLLTFEMPPEAKVYVRVINPTDFEDTACSRELQLTNNSEQFVGFELERVTRSAAVVLDSDTSQGVAGFELRAYDVTEYADMPMDGTRKIRHLLDTDMLDSIDTSLMEPFAVEMTGPDGAINAPFCRRAGRVIKVEVSRTPRTHHMPALVMARAKNSTYVVTYDRQSVVFKAPPRPRVKVSCTDTCTFEEVVGVRFRVMVRPFGPPPPGVADPSARRTRRTQGSRPSHASSHGFSHGSSLPTGEPLASPGASAPDDEPPAIEEGRPEVAPSEMEVDAVVASGSRHSSRAHSQPGSSRPVSIGGSHRSATATAVHSAATELENGDAPLVGSPNSVASAGGASRPVGHLASRAGSGGAGSRLMSPSETAEPPTEAEGIAGSRHTSRSGSVVRGGSCGSRALSPSASQRGHGSTVEPIEEGAAEGVDEATPAEFEGAPGAGSRAASWASGSRSVSASGSHRTRNSPGGAPEVVAKAGEPAAEAEVPLAEGEPAAEGGDPVAPSGSHAGSRAGSRVGSRAPSQAGSRAMASSASQRSRGSSAGTAAAVPAGEGESAEGQPEALAEADGEAVPATPAKSVAGSVAGSAAGKSVAGSMAGKSVAGSLAGKTVAGSVSGRSAAVSVAESAAISILREQHRATLAEITKLEQGWSALAQQYEAEQNDTLEAQKYQLELMLSQLKNMMMGQQERLEALIAAEAAAGGAEAQAIVAAAAMEDEASGLAAELPETPATAVVPPSVLEHDAATLSAVEGADDEASTVVREPEPEERAAMRKKLGKHSVSIMLPTEAGTVMAAAAAVAAAPTPSGAGGLTPSALGPSRSLRNRLRDATSGGGIFSGGFSSVFGVFGPGISRVLSRGRAEGDEEEDEEEALRKLRAAEEEMMAVFNPSPEEQEPWGRVVWDSVTGSDENEDLILDADCEVAVQIFPAWPYDPRSQMLKGRCVGHVGPPEFRFYLPRDGNAFRFWLDRDNALPSFWDDKGDPVLPFHSLARLQPMAPPHRMLLPPSREMKLLRPAAFDHTSPIRGESGSGGEGDLFDQPKHDWVPRLQLINYGATLAPGGNTRLTVSHGCVGGPGFIGGAPGVNRFYSAGPSGGGGPDGDSFFGGGAGPMDYSNYESESILPDGTRVLHRTPSAVQFDPNDSSEDINDLAWQQLRLSDASYLPLERTRLLQFLTRWGSFPHVAGGHCRACSGLERPPDSNPLLLPDAPPTPRFMGEVPQVGFGVGFSAASAMSRSGAPTGNGGDETSGRLHVSGSIDGAPGATPMRGLGNLMYRSRLLPRVELSAQWVFESRPPPRPDGPPVRRSVPDRFSRTHSIMNASEAVYCKSPFFTWWLPNGGGVHVTMSDGLYRELIPLIDSVALSLEYMDAHLEKVRALNEGRNQQGRFLLGHQVVDSFCGGVFIIDVSTAQPFSGVSFILEQLSKTFDYWASETPMGFGRPRFNILLCSREVIECWRSSLSTVTTNMEKRLLPWYEDIKYKMPTAPGFNMVKALRTAGTMAKGEVPIFLMCGGMVESPLNTPQEMSKVLYEMQLDCLKSQAPMQPVVAVELFPMPQARLEGMARVKTTGSGDEETSEKRTIPVGRLGADDVTTEVSVEEAAALGSNIFALLVESLTAGRMRLLEVFREVDKDGDRALDWQQLYRLVLRLVPDATPAHVRYVQLLLDGTGDNFVRYKDLAAAVRACGRGGISVALRDKLEVQLVLHKMAIQMLLAKVTPAEMFARYDNDHDGFWSEKELANMLKDLFPSLRPAEHQLLFDAWKGVDKNQDGRISLDEFSRAFSSGGVPGLPGTAILAHPEQIQRMKEAGELDDFMIMAMKATEENKRLDRVRAVGFPLSETLVRVAGATRGIHRRLDLGRARAFADRIDLKPLEAVREAINANLHQLLAFEKAYGKQLTYEYHHGRVLRSSRAASSLTADPPSPAASSGRLMRPTNSGRTRSMRSAAEGAGGSGSPFAAPSGATAAAAATGADSTAVSSASPSRPRSAARSRPLSRPRSAVASATGSGAGGAGSGISRPASAMASSVGGGSVGGGSTRSGPRPSSASKLRPLPVGWAASASVSDDPHLRKLAARQSVDHSDNASNANGGGGSVSMPPIGSQPWNTNAGGSAGGVSREMPQRSSLLAGLATAGDDNDPRLADRQEYRPPSERSLTRPRASYGSRTPSQGPSAEPSSASIGGVGGGSNANNDDAASAGGGSAAGGTAEGSRPSSAPSRRRRSGVASAAESVSASITMPPLPYSRLPSAASVRKSLPLKTATLGFDADELDASGLPFISPDPNAPASGYGSRPMSASRQSVGTVGSQTSRS